MVSKTHFFIRFAAISILAFLVVGTVYALRSFSFGKPSGREVATKAGPTDSLPAPTGNGVPPDAWVALGRLWLLEQEKKPVLQYNDAYSVTSTRNGVSLDFQHEVIVMPDSSCRIHHWFLQVTGGVTPRLIEIDRASFGESEVCRRDYPEQEWAFDGQTPDGKEAWFSTWEPGPLGDQESGELGFGDRLVRVDLMTGEVTETPWADQAITMHVDVDHHLVLLQQGEPCPKKTGEEYDCYLVLDPVSGKRFPQPDWWHWKGQYADEGGSFSVDEQSSFSPDGRSIAFSTLHYTREDYGPMDLTLLDIATGKMRTVTTGLGHDDVFRIKQWESPDTIRIQYVDWRTEGEVKEKLVKL